MDPVLGDNRDDRRNLGDLMPGWIRIVAAERLAAT
jgi:hypothetical protein